MTNNQFDCYDMNLFLISFMINKYANFILHISRFFLLSVSTRSRDRDHRNFTCDFDIEDFKIEMWKHHYSVCLVNTYIAPNGQHSSAYQLFEFHIIQNSYILRYLRQSCKIHIESTSKKTLDLLWHFHSNDKLFFTIYLAFIILFKVDTFWT